LIGAVKRIIFVAYLNLRKREERRKNYIRCSVSRSKIIDPIIARLSLARKEDKSLLRLLVFGSKNDLLIVFIDLKGNRRRKHSRGRF